MTRVANMLAVVLSLAFVLIGCATVGPPQPPSLNLPQPPSDLRASRKGDRVNLTWTIPTTTTDRAIVRNIGPTLVCRGTAELNPCNTPVGEVPAPATPAALSSGPKPQASYTDTLPERMESADSSAFLTFAVQVLNRDHRGAGLSNQVKVSLARTLPAPRDFRAQVTKDGVVLSWTGEIISTNPADRRYVYRLYRKVEGSAEPVLAGEVPAGAEASFTTTDSNIEWQKTYFYRAEAITEIQRPNNPVLEIEGDDTPEVKVFADDVFPPNVPVELQAVFSGPGQKPSVDLVWAPVTDADLAGYNVYRRQEGASPVKLSRELIKAPAYRDEQITSGTTYFYSVSAVDVRGNESARSEEASESVP